MKRREQSPSPPHEEYSFPAPAGFFIALCVPCYSVYCAFLSCFAYCVVLCTVFFFAYGIVLCVPQTAWRVPHGMYGISPGAGPAPGLLCFAAVAAEIFRHRKTPPGTQKQHSPRQNVLRRGKGCAKIEPRNRNTNNETRIWKQKEIQRDEKKKFG